MALSPASGNFLIQMSLSRLSWAVDGASLRSMVFAVSVVLSSQVLCPRVPLPWSPWLSAVFSQLRDSVGSAWALCLSQLAVSPVGLTSSVFFLLRNIILCYLMPSVLQLLFHKVLVAQSCLTHCDPMDLAHQALLSMEFSRPQYQSRLPFPSPGDLPNPETESWVSWIQADSLLSEPPGIVIIKWICRILFTHFPIGGHLDCFFFSFCNSCYSEQPEKCFCWVVCKHVSRP